MDRLVGSLLVVYVERRVDLQTALGKLRFRELARVFELLTDVVHKVRGDVGYLVVFGGGTGELGLVVDGGVVFFLRDVAVGEHAVQNGDAAFERGVVMLARVIGIGGLRNADEQRRLRKRQVFRALAKVIARGRLDAIAAVAVVDDVQIHCENLVFGVLLFDFACNVHLAYFALDAARCHLVEQDRVAHELLGDGGGALGGAARVQVDEQRANDAHRVDAAVAVEALVLGCHRALEHIGRNLAFVDVNAVFQGDFSEHRGAVVCVDGGDAGLRVGLEVGVIGQVRKPTAHHDAGGDDAKDDDACNCADDGHDCDGTALCPIAALALSV